MKETTTNLLLSKGVVVKVGITTMKGCQPLRSLEPAPAAHFCTLTIHKFLSAAFSIAAEIGFCWKQFGEIELAHKIRARD